MIKIQGSDRRLVFAAERHILKFHVTAYVGQCDRARFVLDFVFRIEDFKNALRRRGGLRHQVDDKAELTQRKEHVDQVQAGASRQQPESEQDERSAEVEVPVVVGVRDEARRQFGA